MYAAIHTDVDRQHRYYHNRNRADHDRNRVEGVTGDLLLFFDEGGFDFSLDLKLGFLIRASGKGKLFQFEMSHLQPEVETGFQPDTAIGRNLVICGIQIPVVIIEYDILQGIEKV